MSVYVSFWLQTYNGCILLWLLMPYDSVAEFFVVLLLADGSLDY